MARISASHAKKLFVQGYPVRLISTTGYSALGYNSAALRYFGHDEQVSAMRKAPESARARMWREFYAATDPNTVTPENEALNQYFSRVNAANQRFKDEGIPGWRTDRGEVFITLGPPDESVESTPGTSSRIIRWTYLTYRLEIYFQDETGFGRLRLTPGSRAEYERILSRVRRQG